MPGPVSPHYPYGYKYCENNDKQHYFHIIPRKDENQPADAVRSQVVNTLNGRFA